MRKVLEFYVKILLTVLVIPMTLTGCGRQDNSLELNLKSSSQLEEQEPEVSDEAAFRTEQKPDQSGGNVAAEGEGLPENITGGQSAASGIEELCVYVCGAVQNPGLVTLPAGSRAGDAVDMAGGMTGEADTAYVNLASLVEDGEKIFIPTKDEVLVFEKAQEAQENGLVNINTADRAALCTLPGIGESRAADIIAYREKNGSFNTIEDIMKVPGIKTSAFDKIRDRISVE